MMLLGRYSRLDPRLVDAAEVLRGSSGARQAKDATIERRFRRYGPYAGLAFWLYLTRDWVAEGASYPREGAKRVAPLARLGRASGSPTGSSRHRGMGVCAPIVMSATTFAGAAQFAAASVIHDGGTVVAAVAAAVLLNARYLAISVAIAPAFEGSRLRRFFESQLLVDESWAVSQVGGGRIDRRMLIGAGLLLFPCWVGGTALGVFGGDILGDPKRSRPRRRVSRALPRPAADAHRDPAHDLAAVAGEPASRSFSCPYRSSRSARNRGERGLSCRTVAPMSDDLARRRTRRRVHDRVQGGRPGAPGRPRRFPRG